MPGYPIRHSHWFSHMRSRFACSGLVRSGWPPISLRAASSVRSNGNLPYSGRTLSSRASVGGDGGSLLIQISLSPLSVLAATAQNLGAFAGYPMHLDRTGEHGGIAS